MPKVVEPCRKVVERILFGRFGRSKVTVEMIVGALLVIHKVRRDLSDYYRGKVNEWKVKKRKE